MASLYEIEEEIRRLMEKAAELEEPDEELSAQFVEMLQAGKAKIDSIAHVLAEMDADDEAIYAEGKRLELRRCGIETRKKRLSNYVMSVMASMGRRDLKGNLRTLRMQDNPPSYQITESEVPERFASYRFVGPIADLLNISEHGLLSATVEGLGPDQVVPSIKPNVTRIVDKAAIRAAARLGPVEGVAISQGQRLVVK